MRTHTLLLLLLSLPGLLLPGGLLLRWCHCTSTGTGDRPETTCCSVAAEPAGAGHRQPTSEPPACACCAVPDDRDTDAPASCRAPCGCTKIVTPEHKPAPVPPDPGHAIDLAAAPGDMLPLPPFARIVGAALWRVANSRPPPPDHARSLPLLL